jgi:hypothetical protein
MLEKRAGAGQGGVQRDLDFFSPFSLRTYHDD